MSLPMPTRCPVTGDPLEVTRLECPTSGVAIEGRFTPNEFVMLSPENLEFMRLFFARARQLERGRADFGRVVSDGARPV